MTRGGERGEKSAAFRISEHDVGLFCLVSPCSTEKEASHGARGRDGEEGEAGKGGRDLSAKGDTDPIGQKRVARFFRRVSIEKDFSA